MTSPAQTPWFRPVELADGTRTGRLLGRALVGAVGAAALLVLCWHLLPGRRLKLFAGSEDVREVPALGVQVGLIVVAVLFAAVAWHASRYRTLRPFLAVLAMAIANITLALTLFEMLRFARGSAQVAPSFAAAAARELEAVYRLCGTVALVSSTVLLLVAWQIRPAARALAALAAALPSILLLVAILWKGSVAQPTLGQLVPVETVFEAPVHAATAGDQLSTSIVQLGALVAIAVVGILAAVDVGEVARRRMLWGSIVRRSSAHPTRFLIAVAGLLLTLFIVAGRHDWLPGPADLLPVFVKTSPESWILALAFAAAALITIRRSEQTPFQRRGVLWSFALIAVLLFGGSLTLSVSRVLQLVVGAVVDRGWAFDFVNTWLPSWSLWIQDWSNLIVPIATGAVGCVLLLRGERSDRVVLLLATASVSAVPGTLYILQHRRIDAGLREFSPATPDQILIVAAAIVTSAVILGRSPLQPTRSLRLVIGASLVTVIAALLNGAVGNRVFHLGLVAPLLVALLFDRARYATPPRAARSVVTAGALLLLSTAGLMTGLLREQQRSTLQLLSYLFLVAPVLLVQLVQLEGGETDEPSAIPVRRVRRRTAAVAFVGLIGLTLSSIVFEFSEGRDPTNTDLAIRLREGWLGSQILDEFGNEQARLSHGSSVMLLVGQAGAEVGCEASLLAGFGFDLTSAGLRDIGQVADVPAVSGQLTDGTSLICAAPSSAGAHPMLVALFSPEDAATVAAQLEEISLDDD